MKFFKQVGQSIYDPAFYYGLLSQPVKKSFGYFFRLTFILALISTVVLSITLLPKAHSFVDRLGADVLSYYPDGLQVTLKGGMVSTNVVEPYIIPIPHDDTMQSRKLGEPENLLVIDTIHPFSLEQFDEDNTLALITKDMFVYKNKSGKVTIQSLKNVPDVVVNEAFISKWANKITPVLNKLILFGPVLIFFVFAVSYIFKLVYFLIAALLVLLLLHLKKIKVSYEKAYQISIHAFTLPLLIAFVLGLFGASLNIPFFPTILLLVIVLINVHKKAGSGAV